MEMNLIIQDNLLPDEIHYLPSLITYLKHMIIKNMKMLQHANIMTQKKSNQWKFLIKTVVFLYFILILEDLQYLIKSTDTNFNKTAISETRILKDNNIVKNINIPNLSHEFTSTESTAGGTLLYIADHLAYQNRNDLNLYEINNLESMFIEMTNSNMSNIIVGCIYRHQKMNLF